MLKGNFIKLLPFALSLFLTPLAKSALSEFAFLFYPEEKAKETKSDPNYVSSSAKKLGIVLQAMPEVQESQGFKALRNDLTGELEKFCVMITQEYVLKANDLNVDAKRRRYHGAICKWIRGLAQAFIAQQNIWYGASVGGPKYYAVNLILRSFLYHFLHMLSSESIHNNTNTQRTSPPWWWSRSPLQRCEFNESMPPEGRAALRIHFPRPVLKGLVKFIKLK